MPPQRVEIVIGVRTLLTLLGAGLLVVLAILSLSTLVSIFLAAVIALGLDPVVTAMVRRGWRRSRAALAVFAGLFLAVFALAVIAADPLWREIGDFARALPGYWYDLQHTATFKDAVNTAGAGDTIRNALKDAVAALPTAAATLLGAASAIFGSLLSLVTLTFLALFFLMERPAITDALFALATPQTEARWRPVLEESIHAISSSLIGNVAISVIAGTVAGLSAWALGMPFPIVLAVLAGLLDLIPQVGATLAAAVLVVVGLTVSVPVAVAVLVIQLVYQQVENYVIYPIVYRRAVKLSAYTTIVAVLIAASLLGVVGAILAVPLAAVIKIVLREASAPRRARMAALRVAAERERIAA